MFNFFGSNNEKKDEFTNLSNSMSANQSQHAKENSPFDFLLTPRQVRNDSKTEKYLAPNQANPFTDLLSSFETEAHKILTFSDDQKIYGQLLKVQQAMDTIKNHTEKQNQQLLETKFESAKEKIAETLVFRNLSEYNNDGLHEKLLSVIDSIDDKEFGGKKDRLKELVTAIENSKLTKKINDQFSETGIFVPLAPFFKPASPLESTSNFIEFLNPSKDQKLIDLIRSKRVEFRKIRNDMKYFSGSESLKPNPDISFNQQTQNPSNIIDQTLSQFNPIRKNHISGICKEIEKIKLSLHSLELGDSKINKVIDGMLDKFVQEYQNKKTFEEIKELRDQVIDEISDPSIDKEKIKKSLVVVDSLSLTENIISQSAPGSVLGQTIGLTDFVFSEERAKFLELFRATPNLIDNFFRTNHRLIEQKVSEAYDKKQRTDQINLESLNLGSLEPVTTADNLASSLKLAQATPPVLDKPISPRRRPALFVRPEAPDTQIDEDQPSIRSEGPRLDFSSTSSQNQSFGNQDKKTRDYVSSVFSFFSRLNPSFSPSNPRATELDTNKSGRTI